MNGRLIPSPTRIDPWRRAVFDSDLAAFHLAVFREALLLGQRGGSRTTWRSWRSGVELGSVRVPVAVWHGNQDVGAPAAHGRWLAAGIPGAALRLLACDGHFSLFVRSWDAGRSHC
jgi:pimeloyl-ACP methyl ester carboxylesterase